MAYYVFILKNIGRKTAFKQGITFQIIHVLVRKLAVSECTMRYVRFIVNSLHSA